MGKIEREALVTQSFQTIAVVLGYADESPLRQQAAIHTLAAAFVFEARLGVPDKLSGRFNQLLIPNHPRIIADRNFSTGLPPTEQLSDAFTMLDNEAARFLHLDGPAKMDRTQGIGMALTVARGFAGKCTFRQCSRVA